MKIVIFLIPGHIQERGVGPTMETAFEEAHARDTSDQPLLTWEEIQRMHDSGRVDFQSHTLCHTEIFTDNRIVEFVSPASRAQLTLLDAPEWFEDSARPVQWGRPLYASAPRLGVKRRYREDLNVRKTCEQFVAEQGGAVFFDRPQWKQELVTVAKRLPQQGTFESAEEQRQAIFKELAESKRRIEAHLPGKKVEHLCYPWLMVSELAIRLSHEAGYKTNFCGMVAGRYIGTASANPLLVGRVGIDFLFTLPGVGRESALAPLAKKLGRAVY